MGNSQLPMSDTDFWWMRYFVGIFLPIVFASVGSISLFTRHSAAIWSSRGSGIQIIPVSGEQAILMGFAYIGIAMLLFAEYYAQYHERMGFYYQWIELPGAILSGGGILWCSLIFLWN